MVIECSNMQESKAIIILLVYKLREPFDTILECSKWEIVIV